MKSKTKRISIVVLCLAFFIAFIGFAITGTVIGGISLLGNIILVAYLLKKKI